MRGIAGIAAEPNCSRHTIAPVFHTSKLADTPLNSEFSKLHHAQRGAAYKNIPNATHICQHITSAPRIDAGEFSAAKIGIVVALAPMPSPSKMRQIKS